MPEAQTPSLGDLDRRLGRLLLQKRRDAGISADMLATRIGASYQQVLSYERGESGLTVSRFVSIAVALGIKADEVLQEALREPSAA